MKNISPYLRVFSYIHNRKRRECAVLQTNLQLLSLKVLPFYVNFYHHFSSNYCENSDLPDIIIFPKVFFKSSEVFLK